jgi:hypothetical protein
VGRTPRQAPASFKKYYPMRGSSEIKAADFANLVEVSGPTLYQYMKEHEA